MAIEWAMANKRTTVVLAGKYVINDRIDIPRDDVTLIHHGIDDGRRAPGCASRHAAVREQRFRKEGDLSKSGKERTR